MFAGGVILTLNGCLCSVIESNMVLLKMYKMKGDLHHELVPVEISVASHPAH